MNLLFDIKKAQGYKNPSQIARVLTEDWGEKNLFCASCDEDFLQPTPGSTKVFDFVCGSCSERYQLKSQRAPFKDKFVDSAYQPMIDSIESNTAPNLLLLHYDIEKYSAENLIIIPRFFLSKSSIEPRKPLSGNARRAGWIGCNIVLKNLPSDGRITIIKNKRVFKTKEVRERYKRFKFLMETRARLRGWTADTLKVIRELGKKDFTLEEVYAFEGYLSALHPENRHIRPKIRQQLQRLRDRGILQFKGNGRYSFLF